MNVPVDGLPSTHDFLLYEMPSVIERFATRFDDLYEVIPGRPDYRTISQVGVFVAVFTVIGVLAADGEVDLIEVHMDLNPPHLYLAEDD